MVITQVTKNWTRIPELGGGLESGDGRDYVIGIEELEKVSVKSGEHTAVDRTKLEACCEKSQNVPARPRHIP